MGFFEGVGNMCYLLSKTKKYDFVVYDQESREYHVRETSAERAVSKVIHDHPFRVHANRCRARKIR